MRCPSCSKFPAKDTDTEPDGDLEMNEDGTVTGDIRIVNTSECCGEELEETSFSVEIDLTDDITAHLEAEHPEFLAKRDTPKPVEKPKKSANTDNVTFSLDSDITRTDESPMKDRNGKNITNPRYRKRFYGIDVSVTITCDVCNVEVAKGTFSDSVQASGMDSLV